MNQTYKTIFQEKKRLVSRLKRMIKPLLWQPNGYQDLKVFVFSKVKLQYTYKLRNAIMLKEFEGFFNDGIIEDSYGGGLVTSDFQYYPIEDLIRLENFLIRKLDSFKTAN